MFNISKNNIITINRGDSGLFNVVLNKGTSINPDIIRIRPYDKIYFGVREPNKSFECSLIRKVFNIDDLNEDGTLTIKLDPIDTEYLCAGNYYYEIKVEMINKVGIDYITEAVYTVRNTTKFIITE